MTLTDDAKKVIHEEVERNLKEHESVLREVRVYRFLIRSLILVVFGGSILGVFKYQQIFESVDAYVDKRIGERAQQGDRLALALSTAESGHWRSALITMDTLYDDSKKKEYNASPELKTFIFVNILWMLANIEEQHADGTWIGQRYWDKLHNDDAFHREFIVGAEWQADTSVNFNFALCSLKYAPSKTRMSTAEEYFARVIESDATAAEQASAKFATSMIALIKGNEDLAKELLRDASTLHPDAFYAPDLYPYRNSFLNSPEADIWCSVATEVTGGTMSFSDAYTSLVRSLVDTTVP